MPEDILHQFNANHVEIKPVLETTEGAPTKVFLTESNIEMEA